MRHRNLPSATTTIQDQFKSQLDDIKDQASSFFRGLKPSAEKLSPAQKRKAASIEAHLVQVGNALIPLIKSTPLMTARDVEIVQNSITTMLGALRLRTMVVDDRGNWSAYYPISIALLVDNFMSLMSHLYDRATLLSPTNNPEDLTRSTRPGEMRHFRRNTAFILMPIDPENGKWEDVKQGVKEVFAEFRINAVRADEIEHDGSITQKVLDEIETSEFLFADLSGERHNVYYEVGYAHALGKRVMMYREAGTKLHFDLSVHNVKEYNSVTELKALLRSRLVEATGAEAKKPQPLTDAKPSRAR